MDNEHDDSPFVIAFPLPFRVLFLAGLGIFGWAANLHGLRLLGVDPASALDLRTHERGPASPLPLSVDSRHAHGALEAPAYAPAPPCSAVYRLALWYGLWCSAAWALYRSATNSDSFLVDSSKHIPSVCALVVLICMISPYDVMQKLERDAFILYVFVRLWTLFFWFSRCRSLTTWDLRSIKRCISSPINHRVYFSDVVFADIFTSYAKVLGDVWLSFCMLLPGGSLLAPPKQYGLYRWILPTFMRYDLFSVSPQLDCAIQYDLVFHTLCAFDNVLSNIQAHQTTVVAHSGML